MKIKSFLSTLFLFVNDAFLGILVRLNAGNLNGVNTMCRAVDKRGSFYQTINKIIERSIPFLYVLIFNDRIL